MGDLTGKEVAMSNKSVLFLAVSLYFWVNFFSFRPSSKRVRSNDGCKLDGKTLWNKEPETSRKSREKYASCHERRGIWLMTNPSFFMLDIFTQESLWHLRMLMPQKRPFANSFPIRHNGILAFTGRIITQVSIRSCTNSETYPSSSLGKHLHFLQRGICYE